MSKAHLMRSDRLATTAIVVGILVAACVVQWHAVVSFFSADDLIHLEQAAGLLPTPVMPWRYLSQVLYFRAMLWVFGPWPTAFMSCNLLLHLANALLVYAIALRASGSRATAALASVLFAACPLLSIVIGHAVVINDISALTFALVMIRAMQSGRARLLAVLSFVVGLMCKESVLLLPFLAMIPGTSSLWPQGRLRVLKHLLPIVICVALALSWARVHGWAPAGEAYAVALWPAPFHNLMTYTRWFLGLNQALPDLVRSLDPQAWHIGLPFIAMMVGLAVVLRNARALICLGLGWWILGLGPVLLFTHSTYPHYMYVALPGLAIAVAAATSAAFTAIWDWYAVHRGGVGRRGPAEQFARASVVILIVIAYSVQAARLVGERYSLRVEGSEYPLDPQIRSMVVAGRAVYSLAADPPQPHTRLAILTGLGSVQVWGARSGLAHTLASVPQGAYDLVSAVLDGGRALRVFFPQLDSVVCSPSWNRGLRGFSVAVSVGNGELVSYGPGLTDNLAVARDLAHTGDLAGAAAYRESLQVAYPEERLLKRN